MCGRSRLLPPFSLPPSLSLHQLQRCLVPWRTECARKGRSSFRWNDSFNEPILASNVPPRWKPILFPHKFRGTVSNCTITRSYRPREKLTGRHAHTIPSPLFFRGELDHGCCCSLTGNGIPTGEIIFVPYPRSFDGGSPRYIGHIHGFALFLSNLVWTRDYGLLSPANYEYKVQRLIRLLEEYFYLIDLRNWRLYIFDRKLGK